MRSRNAKNFSAECSEKEVLWLSNLYAYLNHQGCPFTKNSTGRMQVGISRVFSAQYLCASRFKHLMKSLVRFYKRYQSSLRFQDLRIVVVNINITFSMFFRTGPKLLLFHLQTCPPFLNRIKHRRSLWLRFSRLFFLHRYSSAHDVQKTLQCWIWLG